MRLDRALGADLRVALRSRSIRLYLSLQLAAGLFFVFREGLGSASTLLLVWLGLLVLGFVVWWAGRHRLAHPRPDPEPAARAKAAFALVAVLGMAVWPFDGGVGVGLVLVACGLGGWLWAAWRADGSYGLRERLTRSPRPFVPLFLLIGLPGLLAAGPAFLVGALVALPSGIGQQLLYLGGLFAPLEAVSRRPAAAAVLAALAFAAVHVHLIQDSHHDDFAVALANALIYQANVGLIACLAYRRHRAVVPIGMAHALALA